MELDLAMRMVIKQKQRKDFEKTWVRKGVRQYGFDF
jgi:hypothetical protein